MRALTIVAMLALAGPAAAQGPPPPIPPLVTPLSPPVIVADCWTQARLFESLRSGAFAYCRKNLRYRVGALECFYVGERICWAYDTIERRWTQLRTPQDPIAFPCPAGPEPPVCPRLAGL